MWEIIHYNIIAKSSKNSATVFSLPQHTVVTTVHTVQMNCVKRNINKFSALDVITLRKYLPPCGSCLIVHYQASLSERKESDADHKAVESVTSGFPESPMASSRSPEELHQKKLTHKIKCASTTLVGGSSYIPSGIS